MSNICRLCLDTVVNSSNVDNDNSTIQAQIKFVMPELDVSIISTLILCTDCSKSLNDTYIFKKECMQVENFIKDYLHKHSNQILNLHDIQSQYNNRVHNFSQKIEIRDIKTEHIIETIKVDFLQDDISNRDELILKNDYDGDKVCSLSEENAVTTLETKYTCDKCELPFYDDMSFHEHCKKCLLYKCGQCNKLLPSRKQLDEHQQLHIFEDFLCDICSKRFKSTNSLKQHILQHSEEHKPAICNICTKPFASRKLLRMHSVIHSDREKKYFCKICGNSFHAKASLKRHQITHSDERDFNCTFCDKSFKLSTYLQKHIISRHIGSVKKHICEMCGVKCTSKANLAEHLRTHTGERPFKCESCGKGFAQRGTLTVHIKSVHNSDKPFSCEKCGKTFALKGNLTSHMVIHMENVEKPFVCSECNKSFRINKYLQKHMLRHVGMRTHKCPLCDKGFYGSTALKLHIRTHTGERPYECNICNKTFSQKYNLQIHLRSHKKKHSVK